VGLEWRQKECGHDHSPLGSYLGASSASIPLCPWRPICQDFICSLLHPWRRLQNLISYQLTPYDWSGKRQAVWIGLTRRGIFSVIFCTLGTLQLSSYSMPAGVWCVQLYLRWCFLLNKRKDDTRIISNPSRSMVWKRTHRICVRLYGGFNLGMYLNHIGRIPRRMRIGMPVLVQGRALLSIQRPVQ
jgi:hypothetical protein